MKKVSKKNTVTASLSSSFDKFPSKIQPMSSSLKECISNSNLVQSNALDTAAGILDSIIAKNPEFDINKSTNETKQLLNTFQENMECYPQHISYDGSNVLTVAAALETPVKLSALSVEDQLVINNQLNQHKLQSVINRSQFKVSLDATKDFELFFEYGLQKIKVRLFNGIVHPTLNDLSSLNLPVDIDVDRFQHLAGIKSNIPSKVILNKENKPIQNILDAKPQVRTGKNAFEIRLSVLELAVDVVKYSRNDSDQTGDVISKILQASKDLYKFVENKNY